MKKHNSDRPNAISPESVENIACVSQKYNQIWTKESPQTANSEEVLRN